MSLLLALDVGNTRLHAGLVRDGAVTDAAAWPLPDAAEPERHAPAFVAALRAAAPPAAAFVSVRPEADAAARDLVRRLAGLDAVKLGADRPIPVVNRTKQPGRVGADRLVHALAAFARAKGACIVAAFGTAVTIDAVAPDGAFLGGAILPGLRIQARALHNYCAQLPDVWAAEGKVDSPKRGAGRRTRPATASSPPPAIGRTTVEAIRSGLLYGLAGAARRLVDDARRELRAPAAPLLLTGGDATLLRRLLGVGEVVPHLALEGIAKAYGASGNRRSL